MRTLHNPRPQHSHPVVLELSFETHASVCRQHDVSVNMAWNSDTWWRHHVDDLGEHREENNSSHLSVRVTSVE